MKTTYSFQSNLEPSDEQLHLLMIEVLKDVKHRAAIAAEKFEALKTQQLKEIMNKYKNQNLNNAK